MVLPPLLPVEKHLAGEHDFGGVVEGPPPELVPADIPYTVPSRPSVSVILGPILVSSATLRTVTTPEQRTPSVSSVSVTREHRSRRSQRSGGGARTLGDPPGLGDGHGQGHF